MNEEIYEIEMLKRWIMRLAIAVLVIGCTVGGCSSINKKFGLEDDHFIEDYVESMIESHIGLPSGSLDLTPDSPENGNTR